MHAIFWIGKAVSSATFNAAMKLLMMGSGVTKLYLLQAFNWNVIRLEKCFALWHMCGYFHSILIPITEISHLCNQFLNLTPTPFNAPGWVCSQMETMFDNESRCATKYKSIQWRHKCTKTHKNVQWSTMKYNEVQWSTKKYNEVQWSIMKYNEVHEVQWSTMKYNEIQWNTMKHNKVQWNTTKYSIIALSCTLLHFVVAFSTFLHFIADRVSTTESAEQREWHLSRGLIASTFPLEHFAFCRHHKVDHTAYKQIFI